MQVLNRIRQIAELCPEQQDDWDYFTTSWDREMAVAHEEDRPELFAEYVQMILDDPMGGNRLAPSTFMRPETQRVLCTVPVLRVPGEKP